MKKRSQKISKFVSLAMSEERRYGEQTGQTQRQLNEQLERLSELNAYRHNYAKRLPASGGVSPSHWQDYQSFLQRLDRAVRSQQQIVRDCERNLEIHRQHWMTKRQKLNSLERILEKHRNHERAFENRLEQKQLDELANGKQPVTGADDE